MIYIVAFGCGLKCPHKIHLSTQCPVCLLPPVLLIDSTEYSQSITIYLEYDDWNFSGSSKCIGISLGFGFFLHSGVKYAYNFLSNFGLDDEKSQSDKE